MGLRNGYAYCLGSFSMDGAALLGIREVLDIEDFEYTTLLYESDDEKGMII